MTTINALVNKKQAKKDQEARSGTLQLTSLEQRARVEKLEAAVDKFAFKEWISKAEIKAAMIKQFDRGSKEINNQLRDTRTYWVACEFWYTFFAMLGLFIAIFNYEWALYHDGFKGVSELSGDKMTDAQIDQAIQYRMDVPYTTTIRLIGSAVCITAIILFTMYRIGHINWKNKYYNRVLQHQTLLSSQHDYLSLDHKKSKHSTLVKGERRRSVMQSMLDSTGERLEVSDPREIKTSAALHDQESEMAKLMDESFDVEELPYFDRYFFYEFLMLLVFPWPGFEHLIFMDQLAPAGVNYVIYFTTDLFVVFMFLRIYAIIRHLERYHQYTDPYSRKICQSIFGFNPSGMFCVKYEMVEDPSKVACVLFFSSILILAQIMRIFEIPYEMNQEINSVDLKDYGSAIWLIIITSTTVGYGDIYPHTVGGQIVCVITAFWGTFIVSLLVLVVANIFELSEDEKKAIAFIKQSRTAATGISKAFKFYMAKKKYYIKKMEIDDTFTVENSTFLKQTLSKAEGRGNLKPATLASAIVKFKHKKQDNLMDLFKQNLKTVVKDAVEENELNNLGHEMNIAYRALSDSLIEFSLDSQAYNDELPEAAQELLNASRVVKFEVIHTADMMDKMSIVMLKQGKQIEEQARTLKELRDSINKDGGAQIEEPAVAQAQAKHEDDDIPLLFSLRRTPFYQKKIEELNINHPLLTRTTNLKEIMAKKANFNAWNRKAEAANKAQAELEKEEAEAAEAAALAEAEADKDKEVEPEMEF